MANTTLSEQIYYELYQDITGQRLVCGQKLTLKMLRERFRTSHTPIREALMRLSENGLVTYNSNCSVVVTEFEERDICELFRFAAQRTGSRQQWENGRENMERDVNDLLEFILRQEGGQ